MNFYTATCDKYYQGRRTGYDNNQIIVIAEDLYSARIKFERCLSKLKTDELDFIPNEKLHICDGIMIADGFEDSTYHYGI